MNQTRTHHIPVEKKNSNSLNETQETLQLIKQTETCPHFKHTQYNANKWVGERA